MKTKNNVQKTITKSLVASIAVVFIGFTANAGIFSKPLPENSSFSKMEIADDKTKISAKTFVDISEKEAEETLKLENWMTDLSYFDAVSYILEAETEKALELESWMTNENYFGNSAFEIIEEAENELELEEWMINDDIFNTFEKEEQPLELENWMVSEEIWM